ncbi:endonuclease domain-containing protein [Demequina maris]|uniref:endonuclease domain-containing protein n=1 Tax=Demequina maris TaxID=1638982 RepID=UPI0009E5150D
MTSDVGEPIYGNTSRLARYGITVEEYRGLWFRQGGRCGVCRRQFTKPPSVDHDHLTGRVRGLLCKSCNGAIANFGRYDFGGRFAAAAARVRANADLEQRSSDGDPTRAPGGSSGTRNTQGST